jgi:hypothetical protein
MEGYR